MDVKMVDQEHHNNHNNCDDKHQNNWQTPNNDCHLHKHLSDIINFKFKCCYTTPITRND